MKISFETGELLEIVKGAIKESLREAGITGEDGRMVKNETEWGDRFEACELAHITLPTLHSWIGKGLIEARRVGPRRILINMAKLRADISTGRIGRYNHPKK